VPVQILGAILSVGCACGIVALVLLRKRLLAFAASHLTRTRDAAGAFRGVSVQVGPASAALATAVDDALVAAEKAARQYLDPTSPLLLSVSQELRRFQQSVASVGDFVRHYTGPWGPMSLEEVCRPLLRVIDDSARPALSRLADQARQIGTFIHTPYSYEINQQTTADIENLGAIPARGLAALKQQGTLCFSSLADYDATISTMQLGDHKHLLHAHHARAFDTCGRFTGVLCDAIDTIGNAYAVWLAGMSAATLSISDRIREFDDRALAATFVTVAASIETMTHDLGQLSTNLRSTVATAAAGVGVVSEHVTSCLSVAQRTAGLVQSYLTTIGESTSRAHDAIRSMHSLNGVVKRTFGNDPADGERSLALALGGLAEKVETAIPTVESVRGVVNSVFAVMLAAALTGFFGGLALVCL
jgi:hypothetical protein